MSADPVVEIRGLTKVFRDFWRRPVVRAVEDLHLSIPAGEVFGLLGPNGSGKSTTIKMVLGLLWPTRGVVAVFGRPPSDPRARARLGYLPEESCLYPGLTAAETLDFFGRLFDLPTAERRRRVDQLLEMVGLAHVRRRRVGEFSKGMARRIGLAQALINDPDLVILDEPTAGLDPIGCRQVKDLIRALARRGKTVLLSSHLLADVEDVCDRVAILHGGRLQTVGPVADLLEEKRRRRLTLADVSDEAFEQVVESARRLSGVEPEVDRPRKDLETFFIEVVGRAGASDRETTGAVPEERPVAPYLASAETASAERVDSLGSPDERLRRLVVNENARPESGGGQRRP